MRPKKTWVLIADGSRGRIIRQLWPNAETGGRLDDLNFNIEHKKLSQIMADRAGRSFSSTGMRRSAMEYHSQPVRDQEARFAGSILKTLTLAFAKREFDCLVIVAEPRMLGVIRLIIPSALRRAVTKEIAKDFTKLPRQELYELLGVSAVTRPGAGRRLRP